MRKLLWTIGFVMAVTPALAQTNSLSGNLGTSWLKISPSTRNTGMGNSDVAVPDAYDELDLNPAGLGLINDTYVSLSQDFWAQGLSMEHLIFTVGSADNDGFSLGVNYMNFGAISTYNVVGSGLTLTPTGSYSPMGLNLYAGYGLGLFGGLRAGLAGHFIYDDIQQNFADQTASLDAGLYYQVSGFSLSAVMSDWGWNIDDATLPFEVKTATAWQIPFSSDMRKFSNRITISAEADWFLNDTHYNQYGLGIEYWFQNTLALRGGYQFSNIGDLTGLTGLSLGAGIRYSDWQLDYALVTLGELGVANQIGLSMKLGSNDKPTATPTPSPMPIPPPTATPMPLLYLPPPQALPPVVAPVENTPTMTSTPVMVKKPVPAPRPKHKRRPAVKNKPRPKPHKVYNLRGPHSKDILSIFSMHFDVGSINLEENDAQSALDYLMKVLGEYKRFKFILIAGYADEQKIKPTAPYKSNQELSELRALAFKKYLVENGFDPNTIVTRGYGTNPSGLDPDMTAIHFNNRRIELFIYAPRIP